MGSPVYGFGAFELRPGQRLLLRDGQPQPLGARAMDLLLALVERAGSLVGKAELMDVVWPHVVVEEGNIAVQLSGLRKVIGGDAIATVPGRGYRFTAPVRVLEDEAAATAPAVDGAGGPIRAAAVSPPQLLGREEDLSRLQRLAVPGTCITIVGPGGVGKTALGQALAAAWTAGPVVWVDLAALDEGSQVLQAVCRGLGLGAPPAQAEALRTSVAAALAGSGRLLLLDNAEHVVEAAAAAAVLVLRAAPEATLVVTSQLPLHVSAETVLHLEPLALPAADEPAEQAMMRPAVALLLGRVKAADHRHVPNASALPQLRRLCALLDGLPLALEMAAARVPLLGLQGVIDALEQRVALSLHGARDAPARHRTLQAALAWSHGLLPPAEQRLFRRLAVFSGGFSLDLAVAVGMQATDPEPADRWALIDMLSVLVDRSLVVCQPGDPPRYRMLETLRRHALQCLAESGEEGAVRSAQLRALTALMQGGRDREPTAEAQAELQNVADALAWACAHVPDSATGAVELAVAAAAAAIWTVWRGDAAGWLQRCEPLLGAAVPLATQARWWTELARFQTFERGPRALEAARRACELQRVLGDDHGLFWALIPLLRSRQLDEAEFAVHEQEAQALLQRHPEWPPRNRVVLVGSLAMEYRRRSDFETALQHQEAEAALAAQAGLPVVAANARSNLSATLVGLGRYAEALAVAMQSIAEAQHAAPSAIGAYDRQQRLQALIGLGRLEEAQACAADALDWLERYGVPTGLDVLAMLAAERGRSQAAAQLVGYSHWRQRQRGGEIAQEPHAPWRAALKRAAEGLTPSELQAALAVGAALDADGARRLVLD